MKWLSDELKKLARANGNDYRTFSEFASGEKRRKLERRLRELREEMAGIRPINKEVKP